MALLGNLQWLMMEWNHDSGGEDSGMMVMAVMMLLTGIVE